MMVDTIKLVLYLLSYPSVTQCDKLKGYLGLLPEDHSLEQHHITFTTEPAQPESNSQIWTTVVGIFAMVVVFVVVAIFVVTFQFKRRSG